jgi:uncharacterized surface protein with fasciclin (FAS1) repeats
MKSESKSIEMSNLTQVVNVDKNLKTLKKTVHASDIDQLLSSRGPFTFFAPSDSAFQKLEKGMLEKLFEPQKPQQACRSFKQPYCKRENRL